MEEDADATYPDLRAYTQGRDLELRMPMGDHISYREYTRTRPGGVLRSSFKKLLSLLVNFVLFWKVRVILYRMMGMNIPGTSYIGRECYLDPDFPEMITIEDKAGLAARVIIVTHDTYRDLVAPVVIKSRAFVGIGSIILPGVTIGESAVVGAGSVVTKDVEPGVVVAGNPARFIKKTVRGYRC